MSNVVMTGFFTVGDDPATDVDIYIIGRTSKITNKSPLIRGFRLLDSEKEALTAFLQKPVRSGHASRLAAGANLSTRLECRMFERDTRRGRR